jgi:FixJ family two-component response regulator
MARLVSAQNPTAIEVFLVDDEKSVTDALAWLLDSVKIRSRAFSSASAFLEALGKFSGAACAVVDLRMPEMSGLELQSRISDIGHDLPLIFLTAHGDIPAAVNAMQAGAIDFIQKPFNPEKFLASVQRAMRLAGQRHAKRVLDLEIRRVIDHYRHGSRKFFTNCSMDGPASRSRPRSTPVPRPLTSIGRT